MADRSVLMQRLASLSSEQVMALLHDDRILDAAAAYFARVDGAELQQQAALSPPESPHSPVTPSAATPPNVQRNRRTRPVNAFVAFRSYYVKMFPGVQQKARSGFLTKLWGADPFRNRWVLVAKVYSFVRDEMGRGQTKLSYFLQLCCPLMGIVDHQNYLQTFGWVRTQDHDGNPNVVRIDHTAVTRFVTQQHTASMPSTELELLTRLVGIGYLPQDGHNLINRMTGANNNIMTTSPSTGNPEPNNAMKLEFVESARSNPEQAASQLAENSGLGYFTVSSHHVDDLASMGQLSLRPNTHSPPREPYHYATDHSLLSQPGQPVMDLDAVGDHEAFDIDSPWDLDTMLDQAGPEGSRTSNDSNSPSHDPRQDFHFGF